MGVLMPFFRKASLIFVLVHLHVTHSACCFLTLNLGIGQTEVQNGRNGVLNLVAGANDQVDTMKVMISTLSVLHLYEEEAG